MDVNRAQRFIIQNSKCLLHCLLARPNWGGEDRHIYESYFITLRFLPFGRDVPCEAFVADDCSDTALVQPIKIDLFPGAAANKNSGKRLVEGKIPARRTAPGHQGQRQERRQEHLCFFRAIHARK